MKPKTALWAGLAILALVILGYCLPPLSSHRPRPRPVRYQGVNTLRTASLTLTNTNAAAAPTDRE
jgi:hypothetical protein